MGRDEAITAIEPALAPSLERRIGNDQIAPENEVTRPRIIRVARLSANSGCASCLSPGFICHRVLSPGFGFANSTFLSSGFWTKFSQRQFSRWRSGVILDRGCVKTNSRGSLIVSGNGEVV
jgi:hypothetical protein